MNIEQLFELKEKISKSVQEKAKLQGKIEQIEQQLLNEFGYKTPRHAKRDIEKMKQELEALEQDFSDKCKVIEEKYEGLNL